MTNDSRRDDVHRALFGSLLPQKSLWAGLNLDAPIGPPTSEIGLGALGSLFGLPPSSSSEFGLLSGLGKPHSFGLLGGLAPDPVPTPTPTKRRAFFSFHYADVMRVNSVRNSGEFKTSSRASGRDVEGFYDGSLWERRKLDGPESIKNLIRDGVHNTSAVCVLAGSETWSRQWVRYEIARAVIEGRGLLTVHINGLRHHKSLLPEPRGPNPLEFMAVGAVAGIGLAGPSYFLFELKNDQWQRYGDFTSAVKLPRWLSRPPVGWVVPLSTGAGEYDYVEQDGYRYTGRWIDHAAVRAGR